MTLLAAYNFDEASGSVLDASGNGRNFTVPANVARTAVGVGHTDRGLAPTTTVTESGGPAITGLQTAQRTLMMWARRNNGSTVGWAMEMKVTSLASGAWGVLWLSGQWHIQARNSSGFVRASTSSAPTLNAWHHVAGTYDGSNVRLYIDGTLTATSAITAPLRTDASTLHVFDTLDADTLIDDVRLYDEALPQATIASLMNTPVGPPAAPAYAGWGVPL